MSDEYGLEELWRCRCLSSSDLTEIIGDRAYPQHISELPQPEFPCLSLYTLSDVESFSMAKVRIGVYQMGSWAKNRQVIKRIQKILADLFQRKNFSSDKVQILESYMTNRGNIMFDEDLDIFHGFTIFNIRWFPK